MKNLIEPEVLEAFRIEPVPMKQISDFLDQHTDISTAFLCSQIGIEPKRVYNWRGNEKRKGHQVSEEDFKVKPKASSKRYDRYNSEEKWELIERYKNSDSRSRSELLRQYGIYLSDITRWNEQIKKVAIEALGKRKARSDKKSEEQIRIGELEKELMVQEKTTAKLTAMVMIQKKLSSILNRKD